HRAGRRGRSRALCRSVAAGAGADGDRHLLRHDRPAAGAAARLARGDGHRPCGRRGARAMSGWSSHLLVAPILLPLVVAAAMLLFDERRRRLKRALGIGTSVALLAVSLLLLRAVTLPAADGGPARPLVYLLG